VSGLEISRRRSEGPDFVGEKGVLERLTSASDVDFSFKESGFRSGLGRECFPLSKVVLPAAVVMGEIEEIDGFFACPSVLFAAVVVGALVDVAGRVAAGLVPDAREARGAVRVTEVSALVRNVAMGRLGAAAVLDGVMVERRSAVEATFEGEDFNAVDDKADIRLVWPLTPSFLFSSPEVRDERSCSWSDVVLFEVEVRLVRWVLVVGAGRVGGLFRLDPSVEDLVAEAARGFVVVVEGRMVVVAGRLAAAPVVAVDRGRRGAAWSPFDMAVDAEDDIFFFGGVLVSGCGWAVEASEVVDGAASLVSDGGGAVISVMLANL
jgi:hypothetical protein